jgi:tRNA pseudouridine38-40 synthase
MGRIFIQLAYKGTNFFGWQIQPDEPTIQEDLEIALTKLNRQVEVKVVGCGRTDTGVHASQYFAHADIPFEIDLDQLKYKMNSMVSKDIVIHDIQKVPAETHARFDACKRTYHYFIHEQKDPFVNDISWQRSGDLNIHEMNKACLLLLKHKDFECFSKVKTEVNNFNCDIFDCSWSKTDKGLVFSISANRFLRNMVRAIVGTMIQIGEEKMTLDEFKAVLHSNNRSEAGQSVPARGLFLAKIEYPWMNEK